MYAPEDVDLTLAQRDKILSDTGVKFTKEYFIKNYGLEDEDFDIREDIYPVPNSNFKEFKQEDEELSPDRNNSKPYLNLYLRPNYPSKHRNF